MALLNYGKTYQELQTGNVFEQLIEGQDNPNYVKLYFTNDGHIITHGRDYTYNLASGQKTDKLYTGNGWIDQLKLSQLPIYEESSDINSTIYSAYQVNTLINQTLGESDAWVLKGTVDNTTGLPTENYKTGWSYRVIEAGTYADKFCEVGDIIIALKDYDGEADDSYWHVIQTNIAGYGDGLVFNGSFLSVSPATTEKIGGVKIGDNITLDNDGKLTLTQENIIAALGYTPGVAVATTFSYKFGLNENASLNLIQVATEGEQSTDTTISSITFSGANGINVLSTEKGLEIKARNILIENTSIEANALNFMPGGNICILKDADTSDGTTNIGFDLVWYNLDTEKYEYAES